MAIEIGWLKSNIFATRMKTILFVCTGNYYRSRIAELLFNHYAMGKSANATAISRGFRLNPEKNKGDISPHAARYLSARNIPLSNGRPTRLSEADLQRASRIILMDEQEHRSMLENSFPHWREKVEFWNIADDYVESPEHVLPILREKVDLLLSSLT
jgi:protein-tyrosine phosphatase